MLSLAGLAAVACGLIASGVLSEPIKAPSAGRAAPIAGSPIPVSSPRPVTPESTPLASLPAPAPSAPPVRTVYADWPPATQSTPDPTFTLRVPILMYHRIVALADAGPALPGLVVDPALFAQQMKLLHDAGWHTITLAALQHDLATSVRPPARTFVITIDDGHIDGLTNALPILRQYGFVATYFVVLGRINSPLFLSAADLQTLAAAGMEISDHTMSHVDVARLHGAALQYQIGAAASAIRRITGQAPATFAYPSGEWSLEAVAAVEDNGIGMAVTTQEGVLETWADRFLVPRLRVSPSVSPTTLLRMLTGYALD